LSILHFIFKIFNLWLTTVCLLPLSGVHIYQRMDGCEWDDETEELRGFERHGYDGEDFLSFDLNTKTWISHTPKADTTKRKRDRHRSQNQYLKYFLTQKSITDEHFLSVSSEFPSIFLLHKTSFSLISCLATGFYPNRANLFWRKDGEQLQEDVDHGELLPNHDGTFQMSVDLNIASIAYEDWWRYECVFQLSETKFIHSNKPTQVYLCFNLLSLSLCWFCSTERLRSIYIPIIVAVIGLKAGLFYASLKGEEINEWLSVSPSEA
uniref:Ig-like domain-containing protein n=1 Tax=Acanthochromis polyacanthus TaxID=80966 RepID=A0A3Q1GYF8_9TELE